MHQPITMSSKKTYQSKINKSLTYINNHLTDEINMATLASVSGFSLFHFQRIYKALSNETPYETLLRLRLEKSVFLIKYRPSMNITDISYESGFPSPENFSRQFKARYKISPSVFKKDKTLHNSRIYQDRNPNDFFLCIEESRKCETTAFEVIIEKLPEMNIAFTRAVFGEDGSAMIEKYHDLIKWAKIENVNYQGAQTRFGMSSDSHNVTPSRKYRYDFALQIHKTYNEHELVDFGKIPSFTYATVHCQGDITDVSKAWDYLYLHWLPNSNYMPVDYAALEEFLKGPEDIGWQQFDLKCRVPITKLI